jgi:hypothetical protein
MKTILFLSLFAVSTAVYADAADERWKALESEAADKRWEAQEAQRIEEIRRQNREALERRLEDTRREESSQNRQRQQQQQQEEREKDRQLAREQIEAQREMACTLGGQMWHPGIGGPGYCTRQTF